MSLCGSWNSPGFFFCISKDFDGIENHNSPKVSATISYNYIQINQLSVDVKSDNKSKVNDPFTR